MHHSSELPKIRAAADVLRARTTIVPKVALILGSGLGAYADTLEGRVAVPFGDVPGMPASGVVGHAGNFVFGTVAGIGVVAMQGRIHLYEGHDPREVVLGVRVMRELGAEVLIVTNAAGGVGPGLEPGTIMLIDDHINLTGRNPLVGPTELELGPRFPDMTRAYDVDLGDIADGVARKHGFHLPRGVYAGLLGPTYETPAEVRMVRAVGGDAVGMSTVLEVIAARHGGMRVLGLSCITNLAAGLSPTLLAHDEVTEVAERVKGRFTNLVHEILVEIAGGKSA
jgi:purine-nucleoside phosphorylase